MANTNPMRRYLLPLLGLMGMVAPVFAGESLSASGMTKSQLEDLGEIVEAEGGIASKFRAGVNIKGDYTSNALLTGRHDSSDFIFFPVIDIGYTQPLGPHFSLDIAAKGELGLYGDNDQRNFVGYSMKTTLDWHPKPNAPRLFVAVEPYRYDNLDVGDLITQAVGFYAGTDWGYAFNNGRSLFFAGYTFSTYVADPSVDTRNAHRIVVGLTHQIRDKLTGTLFYAWQYSDFTHFDRHDSKHLIGLNLIYQFHQNWFGTLSGSFADNDSDINIATYQAAGASVGVTYQF
jgi:Putative beta-barrel porin 2